MEGPARLFPGLGMPLGTRSLKLLREATRSTHILLPHAMVSVAVVLGRGMGHVGLAVAGAARGGHPLRLGLSNKVSPPVNGGHPDAVPWRGRAFAVRGGERGALVSGGYVIKQSFPQFPKPHNSGPGSIV